MQLRRFLGGNLRRAPFVALAVVPLLVGAPAAVGNPGDSFSLSVASPVTAGTAFNVTISAIDPTTSQPDPNYSGPENLTWGGTPCNPNCPGTAPDGTDSPVYPSNPVTFTGGVATVSVELFKAESPTLGVADTADTTISGSTAIVVNPAPASQLHVTGPSSDPTAGNSFNVTLAALDAYGNQPTDYSGAKTIDWGGAATAPDGTHTPVYPTSSVSFDGNGVATTALSATFYATGANTLTAADHTSSTIAGSASITVDPASLASFSWTSEPGGTQRAGADVMATVKAYDSYGNLDTNYDGSTATYSGLNKAPNGTPSKPRYGSFVGGINDGPFTDYQTEPGQGTAITVTDGSATATSSSFVVGPAAIGSFTWTTPPGSEQVAGTNITASVTAYDTYGNVKTDYTAANATRSGLYDAPNGTKAASYGVWSNGVNNGPFDTYQTTANTAISFIDGSATGGTSSGFTVDPGPLGSFQWTGEPGSSHVAGASFGGAVTAYDTFGNVKTDYDGTAAQFSGLHDAPNGSATASYVVNWSGGVGTGTFIGYRTEPSPGTNLLVSDSTSTTSTISAKSSSVVITPAALGSFVWTTQPRGTYIAGGPIAAAVTAEDIYGNVKTDYATASASFTGLLGAPNAHPPNPSYGSFSAGVDSGPFNSYTTAATGSTQITVTDTASSITATSNAFGITPAALGSFAWTMQPFGTYVAGSPIGAAVTAYDIYGNIKTDYATSSAQFSGLKGAPNNQPQNPKYGNFANGVDGSFASYTNDLTNSTRITVADTATPSINATSNAFGITPADPATITFGTQPSEAQVNVPIAPPVTVNVVDVYGNPGSFEQVTMALNRPSTGGATSFTGTSTTSVVADANGTASFSNLAVGTVAIGYKMTANASRTGSSPVTATKQSGPFTIAQTVNPCNTQNCSGNANDPNNSSAQVVGSVQTNSNTLGIALTLNAPTRPTNACPTFRDAPGADGSFVNVNTTSTGTTKPNLTITWTIAKSLVNKIPISPNNFNNGTSHYDVCLGAAYIDPNSTPHGFPTKNGGTAVPVIDPVTGITFYWGIIPDCPKKGASLNPCMVSRGKDANGNLILTYFVPFPYDPTGWAGGGI